MIADDDISITSTFADFFSTTYYSMSYDTGSSYPYAINQSCGILTQGFFEFNITEKLI